MYQYQIKLFVKPIPSSMNESEYFNTNSALFHL